jgi:hypothetical protein
VIDLVFFVAVLRHRRVFFPVCSREGRRRLRRGVFFLFVFPSLGALSSEWAFISFFFFLLARGVFSLSFALLFAARPRAKQQHQQHPKTKTKTKNARRSSRRGTKRKPYKIRSKKTNDHHHTTTNC